MAGALPGDFGYMERGLLMTYQTSDTEREEIEAAHVANANGIRAEILSPAEVQKLEPDVRIDVRGGIYFPGDAQLIPQQLVEQLAAYVQEQGVTIHFHTPVTDFGIKGNQVVSIETEKGSYAFDEVVLAAGAWSGLFGSKLGLSLPVQGGKGYSFTVPGVRNNVRIPTLLLEARVAVTPMGKDLRFGGTMEINGVDHTVNMNRVQGIVQAIPKYYPDLNIAMPKKEDVWYGLRPCSPDGLPYIGRAHHLANLLIATGHGMMGVSLAPATARLVTDLITGSKTELDLAPFDPNRFR
jgi:D-amino-acid dehydrogenase